MARYLLHLMLGFVLVAHIYGAHDLSSNSGSKDLVEEDTDITDVLDLEYYGIEDETEPETTDFNVDSEEELTESEVSESEESENSWSHGQKRRKWHASPKNNRRSPGRRKGGKRRGHKHASEKSANNELSSSSDSHQDKKTCRGVICKKVERVVHKHKRISHKFFNSPDTVGLLCHIPDKMLQMDSDTLTKLSEPHTSWFQQWQTWKTNINNCCQMKNNTDIVECITAVGTLSLSWTPTEEEQMDKVDRVCDRVTKAESRRAHHWYRVVQRKQKKHGDLFDEEQWRERKEAILDCCELVTPTDRLECVDDIRAEKADALCEMEEEQSSSHLGRKGYIAKECCEVEDEERYKCFKSAMQWNKFKHSRKMTKKQKIKKHKKKRGHHGALRQDCCRQGKIDGARLLQNRWSVCETAGEQFINDQARYSGKEAGTCKKVLRRCCVRESHRRSGKN